MGDEGVPVRVNDSERRKRCSAFRPDTLTEFELDLDNELITYDPKPKNGRAWVRYSGRAMKVNVYVLGWTRNAVRVRWINAERDRQEAWVWQLAVENAPWVEI